MTDKRTTYDFRDGNGPVPAHQHPNGGGWVADTADVANSAHVGPYAKVFGYARVYENAKLYENAKVDGDARVYGGARVYGDAKVYGHALVYGNAKVFGNALVYGSAEVFGNAEVSGDAKVLGNAKVFGHAWVYGHARAYGGAKVSGNTKVNKGTITNDHITNTNYYKEAKEKIVENSYIMPAAEAKKLTKKNSVSIEEFQQTVQNEIRERCEEGEFQATFNVVDVLPDVLKTVSKQLETLGYDVKEEQKFRCKKFQISWK